MPEDWDSYICRVNDELASIFLDLQLRTIAPDRARPTLQWVMVYVRWPRDNGMPADSEFPALSAMEDRLTSSMAEAFDAVFCGRITTAGRREFYFYASRSGNAEDVVKDALRDFREYEFECGSKPDPAWTQYLDVLFPSAEDQQSMKNRKVLDVLQQKGDSLSAPRNLRHWIYFATEADPLASDPPSPRWSIE